MFFASYQIVAKVMFHSFYVQNDASIFGPTHPFVDELLLPYFLEPMFSTVQSSLIHLRKGWELIFTS